MLLTTDAWDYDFLAQLETFLNGNGGLIVDLYTNLIEPTKLTTLSDLTFPTDPAYAPFTALQADIQRSAEGVIQGVYIALFSENPVTIPFIIQGVALSFNSPPQLLGLYPLKDPIAVNDFLDVMQLFVVLNQTSDLPGRTRVIR